MDETVRGVLGDEGYNLLKASMARERQLRAHAEELHEQIDPQTSVVAGPQQMLRYPEERDHVKVMALIATEKGHARTEAFIVWSWLQTLDRTEKRLLAEERGMDPLLGIPTKAVFETEVPGLLGRVIDPDDHYGEPVTLTKLDLAGLKRTNGAKVIEDEDGTRRLITEAEEAELIRQGVTLNYVYEGSEEKGDAYLKLVVDTILEHLRPLDMVFRTGGDELTVVMPNTEDGEGIMERLTEVIDEALVASDFPEELHLGVYTGSLTVQPGTADALPHDPEERAALLSDYFMSVKDQIDKNMRAAKRAYYDDLAQRGISLPADERLLQQERPVQPEDAVRPEDLSAADLFKLLIRRRRRS